MKTIYNHLLLAAATLLGLPAAPAVAQVELSNLGTYTQDFNTLSASTAQSGFVNNATLPGVYARAMLTNYGYYPSGTVSVPYFGNDGSQHTSHNYYSFGNSGSSDRALGGIGTTVTSEGTPLTGTGYVAMRFVNKTGRIIANLDVSYAMEQWYNSGINKDATVGFDYQLPVGAFTGAMEAGSWTAVPALSVVAPSTASLVASRNGNAPANRRVVSATLMGLNLAVDKEVVLRWKYVMNSATNGNGVSIDDVAITPQAGAVVASGSDAKDNIWYYDGTGDFNQLGNWYSKANPNNRPSSFTANDQVYYITTTSTQDVFMGTFIGGSNSKVVVGDGVNPVYFRFASLLNSSGTTTKFNVANNATMEIAGTDGPLPILGTLSHGSTVHYKTARKEKNGVKIDCATFGSLKLSGGTVAALKRNVTVSGTLTLAENSRLDLEDNDLTILKGGAATSDGTAFVRTLAGGALRQTVSPTTTPVLFPVGQSTYNPAWLSQRTTATEDLFGVIVSDSIYSKYVKTGKGYIADKDAKKSRDYKGYLLPEKNPTKRANHTWYISEADLGGSNLTMALQAAIPATMLAATSMVGHFHADAWDIDATQKGQATPVNLLSGVYKFERSGITDFSPFTVEGTASPLPVELIGFDAKRVGSTVACTWATATEMNNDYFELERSSDGQSFQAITKLAGAGTTSMRHDYRFVDATPARGVAYYRLRQVDLDGTSTYSPVRMVMPTLDAKGAISLYPNPASQSATLDLSTLPTGDYTVQVLDLTGRQLASYKLMGGAQHPLNLQQVKPSTFVVRVQGAALTQSLLLTRE